MVQTILTKVKSTSSESEAAILFSEDKMNLPVNYQIYQISPILIPLK